MRHFPTIPNVVDVDWFYIPEPVNHTLAYAANGEVGLFKRANWTREGCAGIVFSAVPSLYPGHFAWWPQTVLYTETLEHGIVRQAFQACVIIDPISVTWYPDQATGIVPMVSGGVIRFGYERFDGGEWTHQPLEHDLADYARPGVAELIYKRRARVFEWLRREEERKHANLGVIALKDWLELGAPALLSDWEA